MNICSTSCAFLVNFKNKTVQPSLLFVVRPITTAYLKYIVLKESSLPCSYVLNQFLTSCWNRIICLFCFHLLELQNTIQPLTFLCFPCSFQAENSKSFPVTSTRWPCGFLLGCIYIYMCLCYFMTGVLEWGKSTKLMLNVSVGTMVAFIRINRLLILETKILFLFTFSIVCR